MSKQGTAFDEAHDKMEAYATAAADSPNRAARDWAGFFQGLAAFIAALAPAIIPLFLTTDKTDNTTP